MNIIFESGNRVYAGTTIDEVAKEVLADNRVKNLRLKHKPFPEDYAKIYKMVRDANQSNQKSEQITKLSNERREEKVRTGKRVTLREAVSGAKAIIRVGMGDVVSSDEMARRASICATCPLLSKVTGCTACGAGKVVSQVINSFKAKIGRGIRYPAIPGVGRPKDFSCGACGCSFLTMFPAPMDSYHETEAKNLERPAHCWVRKDSDNYKQTQ